MSVIALFFFGAGAALLIFGFRKNNRALLTIAAFLWLASGAWNDFANGLKEGLSSTAAQGMSSTAR